MRAYAAFQGLRYIVLTVCVIACAASQLSPEWLALGFPIAELATASSALAYLNYHRIAPHFAWSSAWGKLHLSFASRAFMSGILIEANSKLDILVAGYFLSDRSVGIYSFVAMFFDGLIQLLTVVRTNFNPLLVSVGKIQTWADVMHLRTFSARLVVPATTVLAALSMVIFFLIGTWLLPSSGLENGFVAGFILLGTISCLSVLMPFDNLLLLNGYPGRQSLQYFTTTIVGLVAGILLVPQYGINGAAAASAMGYAAGAAFLVFYVRKIFQWNLITNTKRE